MNIKELIEHKEDAMYDYDIAISAKTGTDAGVVCGQGAIVADN